MRFYSQLCSVLVTFAVTSALSPGLDAGSRSLEALALPPSPFTLTYLFTANLNLGQPEKPIQIAGGVRVIEPILNGTVSGPAINGTVNYSLATPTVVNNDTTQIPVINVVGTSDDGEALYIYEQGIGLPTSQVTRIIFEIGGKYAYLQNGFIVASVSPSADRKTVKVLAYLVENAM